MKKVSVIIPCYNQEEFVEEAINSVLNQTYKNIEIICFNDGSTDNSSLILKNLSDKYSNIKIINENKNHGVIYARNKAIEFSNGDYILPLDADDKIDKTYVEKAVKILNKNPKIGVVYCQIQFFGNASNKWHYPNFSKNYLLYESCITCCSMFRKSDFEKAGKYKNYMDIGCEDWDLWLSIYELGVEFYKIDEILFFYRRHNKPCRTDIQLKNRKIINSKLIQYHKNLYLNDENFTDRIFNYISPEIYNKMYLKKEKYKKLFNSILIAFILEFITILIIFRRIIV